MVRLEKGALLYATATLKCQLSCNQWFFDVGICGTGNETALPLVEAPMLLEEATEACYCVFFDLQTLFNPALAGCGIAPVFVQSIF